VSFVAVRQHVRRARGFSLVEMLVALTISATLLTATLGALDASFRSYKETTESASTNVVSRLVMHRIMTMIRTGSEFGPYPANPIAQPQLVTNEIEFVSARDDGALTHQVTRIERRDAPEGSESPFELWYVIENYANDALVDSQERVLIRDLQEATFTLEYDVGPRLRLATVDLTIRPNDLQDAAVYSGLQTATIRLVSSVAPRRVD
jgi:prepilin-type N-terminal cleavage/methylation domain-containing protein